MYIKNLKLKNYRNYEQLDLEFDENLNIFYGDNAQGKTNILESIYLVSTCKSKRGSKDKEIIKFENENASISLEFVNNDSNFKIEYLLSKNNSKKALFNGYQVRKASQILGKLKTVFFTPDDLNIIKESPEKRRNFINMELCQIDKIYLENLIKYNKTLKQRNKLLKEIDPTNSQKEEQLLDVYDEILVNCAKQIINTRETFLKKLNEIVYKKHKEISKEKENLEIIYKPNCKEKDLEKKFKDSRKTDIYLKTTSIGPHRDDIEFLINNKDVKKYASQGQQRSVSLSLKLSEIDIIKNQTGETPILLLDDVLSELDKSRQNFLLSGISNIQTFITCTGMEMFEKVKGNIFEINQGKAKLL